MEKVRKTRTHDMTTGSILRQLLGFALPLMIGNIFQMLYNTVDSIVVGKFVGTQALAAVGSTTMITNMGVFFFNGFSVGAGVVIGMYFGAKDESRLHRAVETAIAATIVMSIAFTVLFSFTAKWMLNFMDTPADVIAPATTYLRIYFLGLSGLLFYNIGSGILRAVGDTTRPLYFLIMTSVMNIVLDLLFVVPLHMGIAGAALATIISQGTSAILIMILLIRTDDVYRFSFRDLCFDRKILRQIFAIGLPNAIQSVITAFSNVFVQSYINYFGSACMAGWSCYNKINDFVMLPMSSMAMSATTFVSQNVGARQMERANRGTIRSLQITLTITLMIASLCFAFSSVAVNLFTSDAAVVEFGVRFIHMNIYFLLFNCVNHVLAGALRGRGDSTAPMVIMLVSFVALRQIYLFTVTHFFANTPTLVGLGYPVGWSICCILEVTYFFVRWNHKEITPSQHI